MVYYLDRAPANKQQFEALKFNVAQSNFIVSMMTQCNKLRQRDVIINLFRHSLPDQFTLELIKKENDDKTRSWFVPLVVESGDPKKE